MFSCEFCEIFKNIFFTEHLRTTASVRWIILSLTKMCLEHPSISTKNHSLYDSYWNSWTSILTKIWLWLQLLVQERFALSYAEKPKFHETRTRNIPRNMYQLRMYSVQLCTILISDNTFVWCLCKYDTY